ncbi:MAG: transglutaminase-like putative cysteine protease, partial [Psychromonas sp.]
VLLNKRGVCQDFAQPAISCLRSLGFAAPYISGYLETFPLPG